MIDWVLCSGAGATLWQVIAGRVIGGTGGGGMTSLVSIIITGRCSFRFPWNRMQQRD